MIEGAREAQFLAELKTLGGAAGNGALRARLGWEDDVYTEVKRLLVQKGDVELSRGRGGGVRLRQDRGAVASPAAAAKPTRSAKAKVVAKTGFAAMKETLWSAADKLRGNLDAAEYKHVALGLIFLKYISDRFEERRAKAFADPEERDLADERDLYLGDNVFWVPEEARWSYLKDNATSTDPSIGALIDRAMRQIEEENPSLKGVLTKTYARPELDQTRLGEVVKLFSDLTFQDDGPRRAPNPCSGARHHHPRLSFHRLDEEGERESEDAH